MIETKPNKKAEPIVFDEHLEDSQEDTYSVKVVDDTYTFQTQVPPMKVLFIIHGYADTMGSGAERMVQSISEYFVSRGHEVTIAVKRPNGGEVDGVKIVRCQNKAFEATVKDYDVVISHLDLTNYAMNLAREHNKPYIWIAHNTHKDAYVTISKRPKYAHIIYNAEWVREELGFPNPGILLTPPTQYSKWADGVDHYGCEYITLVNHNRNKGGSILVKIAREMPDRKFLAVEGSYDIQIKDTTVPNIKYVKNTQDMKKIYGMSRIVLMPSDYESWGMVASEAAAAGCPVICTATKGLVENLGDAGVYVERTDIEAWVAAIKSLDDKAEYKKVAKAQQDRIKEQDPMKQLEQLENWIYGIRQSHN